MPYSANIFIIPCCAYHGCIICTQYRLRIIKLFICALARLFKFLSKLTITRHSSGKSNTVITIYFSGFHSMPYKHVNNRLLKRRGY